MAIKECKIKKECKITISGNTASIDKEIYLYKNDMNIKCLFDIVNSDYVYTKDSALDNVINASKASYAQVKFKKDDIEIDFDVQETSDGKAIIYITEELTDEDTELGDYTIQIRLFDESKTSVITLPPVNNCIHIMRPIFEKVGRSTNVVDEAAVDEAIVTYAEPVASTNEDGTFAKKTWVPKEKITTAELNRIEEGIFKNSSQIKENQINLIEDDTSMEGISDTVHDTLETDDKRIIGGINEVNKKVKDIAKKIDKIASSGGNGGNSGGTTTSDYDTEISLPFTPSKDTDVKLIFSPGEVKNYKCEINSIDVNKWTDKTYSGNNHSIENIQEDGVNCLKGTFSDAEGYHIMQIQGANKYDSTHTYLTYFKVKLGSKIAGSDKPNFITGISTLPADWNSENISTKNKDFDIQFNKTNTTAFQEIMVIGTVPSYNTNKCDLRIFNDGTIYVKKAYFIDLTLNELETKTWDELKTMCQDGSFDGNSGGTSSFSATIINGTENTNIETFESGDKTQYITVRSGKTLNVVKNGNYPLANVVAKIKSTTSTVVELEDYQYILNTRFKGKKVVFEGDSITDSDFATEYNGKSWADYLKIKLKLGDVINNSVGGSTISTNNTATLNGSVVTRILETNYPSDVKLFIIFAGTNDWNNNVILGDINSTDSSTMLGALNNCIDTAQTKCPDATIIVIAPMHRSGMRTATRTAGKLEDVGEDYKKVCKNWGVNFFDSLENFGMNAYNSTIASKYYIESDGQLHPNPAGHKRIATRMAGYISTL